MAPACCEVNPRWSRQLDYYFRIDTDTRFVRPHREDFFDIMAAGNYTYAWVLGGRERGTLTEGLCVAVSWSLPCP